MRRLNLIRSTRQAKLKYHLHAPEFMKSFTPPAMVDLRPLDIPIFDQGDLGSCTSQGWGALCGFIQQKQLRDHVPLGQSPEMFYTAFEPVSRLFIYYNERLIEGDVSSDDGAQISDGADALKKYGICLEQLWPYSTQQVFTKPDATCYDQASHHLIPNEYQVMSLSDIKQSLANGYPVVIGIMVYDDLMNVGSDGIVPMPGPHDVCQGGHCVEIVGYDDHQKRAIVRNSWGTSWGAHGYFYLPYPYLTDSSLMDDARTIRP